MKKHFKLEDITIGSDLEMFITDQDDNLESAIGIFGGTKTEPKYIGELCYIQEDNILVEANIPPVDNFDDFYKYISYIKSYINETHPEYKLKYSSSETAPLNLLLNEKAREFGCEPVFIVDYNNDGDIIPEDDFNEGIEIKRQSNKRTGGYHIHIGYKNPTEKISREIVKLFEKNVTLQLLSEDIDDHNRREFYGKCGEYRIKPYGLECRSVGSYFLKDESTIRKVWDGVQKTITEFNNGERVSKQEFEIIKDIIDNYKK